MSAPRRLRSTYTERAAGGLWGRMNWRERSPGYWTTEAQPRVAVEQLGPGTQLPGGPAYPLWHGRWVAWLDGAVLIDINGVMLFDSREEAAYEALLGVQNGWHGPEARFDPNLPWRPCAGAFGTGDPDGADGTGALLRSLVGTTEGIDSSTTPVAIIRTMHGLPGVFPVGDVGWGVFLGIDRKYSLLANTGRSIFDTAEKARQFADHGLGLWIRRKSLRSRR